METLDYRLGNYVNCSYEDAEGGTQTIVGKVVALDITGCADYPIMVETKKANEESYDINPIPITEEWLLKFGFEESECINYKGKKEFIISPKDYAWELGFVIGNYPISNPNIGCLSLLQSKDEQISAIPKHLVKKNNWTEQDKIEADNYTVTSKAWRQPIAYNVVYVHHLQNLYHSLTGQELI